MNCYIPKGYMERFLQYKRNPLTSSDQESPCTRSPVRLLCLFFQFRPVENFHIFRDPKR